MLNTPIKNLPKVGTSYAGRLKKLNITTVKDLLYHFPVRYEDFSTQKINSVQAGENVSIEGSIWQAKNIRTKYGKYLTLATINDGTSSIQCVWFNQAYLTQTLKPRIKLGLAGKVDYFNNTLSLINPEYEIIESGRPRIHTSGLVPVYPETRGVSSKWLRNKIRDILDNHELTEHEILPEEILKRNKLGPWYQSMVQIHFPENAELASFARNRFAFEEMFLLQLNSILRKNSWKKEKKVDPLYVDQEEVLRFIESLPFELTASQKKVSREIISDLNKEEPMNRLLQGDVGSGKTVVAAIASFITITNGFDVVFMAPTEILAKQHFQTLSTLLKQYNVAVGLQTGSKKVSGKFPLIVGTHALLHSKNFPKKVGLTIIDEQHRFGVEQRAKLREKGLTSHFLTMSATPIPRTVALTLYGDLDLSILDEMPKGRQKIKTYVVPREKRDRAYEFIRREIKKGKQAFVICPLIEPSETLSSVKSAVSEWERLKNNVFPELKLDLLHGRLKSNEKDKVLSNFKKNESNILVATPVVEVGIDIPNATIMLIEASERFGLAQLHQIRGRVGRGADQSYCLLFTESTNPEIVKRLKFMEQKHLGFELAELDFKLRGPGQLYGTAQHGVPNLKLASFSNTELIKKTSSEALKAAEGGLTEQSMRKLTGWLRSEKISPD